jgi:hypothetical protein
MCCRSLGHSSVDACHHGALTHVDSSAALVKLAALPVCRRPTRAAWRSAGWRCARTARGCCGTRRRWTTSCTPSWCDAVLLPGSLSSGPAPVSRRHPGLNSSCIRMQWQNCGSGWVALKWRPANPEHSDGFCCPCHAGGHLLSIQRRRQGVRHTPAGGRQHRRLPEGCRGHGALQTRTARACSLQGLPCHDCTGLG